MSVIIVVVLSLVLFFFSNLLGKLFIKPADYGILPIVEDIMRFLAPLYVLYVFGELLSGAVRGTGETLRPMLLTLIGTCGARILWILFIVPMNSSIMVILASYPVSWLLTSILFTAFYLYFSKIRFAPGVESEE